MFLVFILFESDIIIYLCVQNSQIYDSDSISGLIGNNFEFFFTSFFVLLLVTDNPFFFIVTVLFCLIFSMYLCTCSSEREFYNCRNCHN